MECWQLLEELQTGGLERWPVRLTGGCSIILAAEEQDFLLMKWMLASNPKFGQSLWTPCHFPWRKFSWLEKHLSCVTVTFSLQCGNRAAFSPQIKKKLFSVVFPRQQGWLQSSLRPSSSMCLITQKPAPTWSLSLHRNSLFSESCTVWKLKQTK